MWNWITKILGTDALVLDKEYKPKRARTKRGRYKGDKKSNRRHLVGKRGEQKPNIVVTVKGEKNDNHSSDHEVDYFKDFGEVA